MAGPLPLSLLPDTAEVDAFGAVSVGGVALTELAADFGTPLFVYDEQHLENRCREAVEAWGDGVAYASKAFLCKAMAKLAHEQGMMIDVATGGELYVVQQAGVPADRIILHGNNKTAAELLSAMEAGVAAIVVDSMDEMDRIDAIHAAGLAPATVMIRITPGVKAETHKFVQTGQDDSKFGFTVSSGAALKAIERASASSSMILVGVHAHIGSQVFEKESFRRAVERLEQSLHTGEASVFIFELTSKPDIDGSVRWNQARLINHSCKPNCETRVIRGHVWIIALRDIDPGEELSYDYGYDIEHWEEHPCRCGHPKCVGYIVRQDQHKKLKRLLKKRRKEARDG